MAEALDPEQEALLGLVMARHGGRVAPDQVEELRRAVRAVTEASRALRAVRLGNADSPCPPFSPLDDDGEAAPPASGAAP